jgi:hypothetical protein
MNSIALTGRGQPLLVVMDSTNLKIIAIIVSK